jgi:hypothetical protein
MLKSKPQSKQASFCTTISMPTPINLFETTLKDKNQHHYPTIYYSKQNKRKLKAKIKTLQEQHISYEAIKI